MTAPETITLALWATNLGKPLNGIDGWIARIDAKMAEAKAAGADLLLMPEYACEQWLSFKPNGLAETQEIAWMAEQAVDAIEHLKPLAETHDLALLAGTVAWKDETVTIGPPYRNRAFLFLPDGRVVHQDKLALTPHEQDPDSWDLKPGEDIRIVEWKGMKVAPLVCLDVEMPALAVKLAPHEIDLLLVPSMTSMLSGYARVFGCAKARAIELMTSIAVCGVIGSAPGSTQNPTNVSGCAVYTPCEAELGFTGIHAELPAVGTDDGDGPFLIARDVPIGAIRKLRSGAAEVWPGAWPGDHVTVSQAG
ncbi:MAG: nitrilase-related carbon-nitrogen hydrolase [Pseudomonadota bacterium]